MYASRGEEPRFPPKILLIEFCVDIFGLNLLASSPVFYRSQYARTASGIRTEKSAQNLTPKRLNRLINSNPLGKSEGILLIFNLFLLVAVDFYSLRGALFVLHRNLFAK